MLPPEAESVEENVNEPIDTPEEESEQEGIPDGEDDWELAGEEIPEIPVPDDTFEFPGDQEQEPDQWPDGDWADPDDLAGQEIPEIPVPDDTFEFPGDQGQEPDQWPDGDWADPDDLAGQERAEIPVPDDTFEQVSEPDQEPVETPEQESDQWSDGDWVDPEDLAGESIYPISVPDDTFDISSEQDQEPDQWPDGDWTNPEDLAGEELNEISLPDDTFEVVSDEDQEPIETPDVESDQWPDGDWADPEDLAGEEIYTILVPDDTFEFENDEDQEPIESPIQEENQEKEEVLVYANSEYSSPDFLKLKSVIVEIVTQEKSQDIQKSQEINSQKDEKKSDKEINKESRETKEKDFIKREETEEVKAEIKKEEEIRSSTQNEKTQEISKELKEKYKEQTGRRPIYAGKITKSFEEWLKEQQESEKENQEKKEHEEIKEDWEILLEKWINDVDENEISKEIKDELIEIIKKYRSVRKLEKILMVLLAKPNHTKEEIIEIEKLIDKVNELIDYLEELFVTFERFKNFYNKNVIWSKDRITEQKIRFVKHLAQKLRRLKETTNDENTFLNYNWKAFIKENIDLIKDLNASDKELVSKIINKADISNEEREKLIYILSKLDTEQLIEIFGESFKHHTKNYIRWGWDFDQGIKKLMIKQFFESSHLLPIRFLDNYRYKLSSETLNKINDMEPYEILKIGSKTYSTLELIENLYVEINRFAFILAKRFLNKFKLSLAKVSLLWGYSSTWLGRIKRGQRNTLDDKRDEKLIELESILIEKLNWRAIHCLLLIKKYRKKKLSTYEFIDKLQLELGKITDVDIETGQPIELKIPFNLFSYILWGTETFLYEVKNIIKGKSANPNPDYKFSLKHLDIFNTNLNLFFDGKAKGCREIIENYIKKNPNLKEYPLEKTTIKNKTYFSVIKNPDLIKNNEVIYWYGFLCADGAVYKSRSYVIYLRLKATDKERVYRFANMVGLDRNRVKIRILFRKYKGRIIESKQAQARFGSKRMYKDIMSQGYTSSHNEVKKIPKFVYDLIKSAKSEAIKSKIYWWYTTSGKKALSWLVGLYDGDGYLKDKKYGVLVSGKKEFLNLIAKTFNCKNRAKSKGVPSGFSSSESYYLRLGTDLFDTMLNSFELSMKRKRPLKWKFGSHIKNYLD